MAPGNVSSALVYLLSLPWLRRTLSLFACDGISWIGLGWYVLLAGAEPAGRICVWNSGTRSLLDFLLPSWCCGCRSSRGQRVCRGTEKVILGGGGESLLRTYPLVHHWPGRGDRGLERALFVVEGVDVAGL